MVDFVIAFEALLLTQNGSAITQELSYRFAVNGASLLRLVLNSRDGQGIFRKMKAAYSVRSDIVHGAADVEQSKALRSGGFDSLRELSEYLETNLRRSIFWIESVPDKSRPYSMNNGWEELLF